MPLGEETPFKQ